jgi:hypothetical protein
MAAPRDPLAVRSTSSREQAARIDRGYFKRANALQAARRWLVCGGIALAVAWCAWGAIDVPAHHSPGPVAAVHATWEQDCEACHVPLSPIKAGTWLTTPETRREADAKCEKCHAGPAHHPLEIAAEVGSCASCHADHRGREHDLARVGDQTCTACHGDIAAHRTTVAGIEPARETAPITRFDDAHHPAFAGLASDPGKLKFSHGRHMRAGLTFGLPGQQASPDDARGAPLTYAMLPPADQARYRPADARLDDAVQLSCASCHEFGTDLPAGDLRIVSAVLAGAKPGAYALPMEFERHCAACHQLPLDAVAAGDAPGLDPDREATVPHGLGAAELRRFIESVAVSRALAETAPADPRERPLPTSPPGDGDRLREDVTRAAGNFAATTRSFVRGTCQKCHEIEDTVLPAAGSLLAGGDPGGAADWFRTVPTNVPDVWLKKARFDHQPHRAYDCRECHAAAYPGPLEAAAAVLAAGGSPLDNPVVMIAGRESCTGCHAPSRWDAAKQARVGGARFDCVECHGYHGPAAHPAATVVAGEIPR